MSTELVPVSDIERMAAAVAKSGLFGVKQPEQAMALMLVAQAEGLHPAIAARDYHIIQGRPALKADAMLARFQAAGGKVRWTAMTDTRVAAEFSHAQGGSIELEWTIEMAKRAGLTKNPTWQQYPRAMLRARCVSEGIRTVFPGVVVGTYTPEEVEDMPHAPAPRQVRDMGPAEIVIDAGELLEKIEAAASIAALEALRPDIRRLQGDDKQRALAAAQARAAAIRAAEAETIEAPATEDPV